MGQEVEGPSRTPALFFDLYMGYLRALLWLRKTKFRGMESLALDAPLVRGQAS